jgi:predicted metal-dependent peptidase
MADVIAEKKLRAARARVSYLRPYFSHQIYSYVLVEAPACPSMGVDEYGRLYWNPRFVYRYSIEQLTTVLLHETGHTLRQHHKRARALGVTSMTADAANVAQDAEINDDLRDEAEEHGDIPALPGRPYYPESIGCEDHDVWEAYYSHLMDNAIVVRTSGGEESDEADEGEPGGENGGGGSGPGEDGKMVIVIPHDCGSGAHGAKRPWEQGPNSGTEVVSDADQRDIRRLTAEAIAERQRTRGDVPGGWVEWADDMLKPHNIPWDQELAGGMRWAINDVAGKVFHVYRRPSRRQSAVPDIVLPEMRRPQPFVCLVGDTSGSMDETDLALVRGTAEDICRSLGARVVVRGGRDIELRGRGGTNMAVGIDYALTNLRPKPDVIVVTTDCETGWPAVRPPNVRVIVCAINATDDSVAKIPTWARTIRINAEDLRTPEGPS